MVRPLSSLSLSLLLLSACSADLPEIQLGPDAADTTDTLRLSVLSEGEVSVSWYRDGAEVTDLQDALEVSADQTAKGQRWTVLAWHDEAPDRTSDPASQIEITIANAAPTLGAVTAEDDSPPSDRDISVQVEASDPDDDALDIRYEWSRDGEVVKGQTEATVDADVTQRGETWTVDVYVSDDDIEVGPVSATVRVGNVAPIADGVSLGPAEADETTELVATVDGYDPDGDVVTWSYVWLVDGEAADVPADTKSLTGAHFDRGQQVQVVATPSDGTLDGPAVTSEAITIGNTVPSAISAAITPTEARETDTLTCVATGASDPDGDTVAFLTSWSVDGTEVSTASELTGASFDKGDEVLCALTPFDGTDAGESVSASLIILNSAPTLDSVALPSDAAEGDTLGATLGTAADADGDAITFTYAWSVDGSAAGTADELGSDAFSRDQSVVLTVTPNDGTEDGAPVASVALIISNTAPVVDSASLSPAEPGTEEDVVASASASDVDGDAVSLTYAWTVDGTAVSGVTGDTLAATHFERGEAIGVEVTPNDGTDAGTAFAAATVTIANTAPSLASVSIDPGTVFEDSTASCVPTGFVDADGDEASYAYSWTVAGTEVSTDESLSGDDFDKGDVLICTVTPSDGLEDGTAVASSAITVSNTAPVADSISLSPSTPSTDDDIVATVTSSDLDGDTVTTAFVWTVDGSVVSGETSDTLGASFFAKGQEVIATVTPSDGDDDGVALASSGVTVVNSAPSLTGAAIDPGTVAEGTTATCSPAGYSDPDGDTAAYTYAWTVNGTAAGTSASLDGTAFDKGDVLLCTVTPGDGTDTGTAVTTASVTVVNTLPVVASVSLSSSGPTADVDLVATISASDADGDSISTEYAWSVNGTVVRTVSNSDGADTLSASEYGRGDRISVTVTPSDEDGAGSAVTSSTATVVGSIPVISAVTLSPSTVTTSDAITATPSASDVDGDSITYAYTWYLDAGGTGSYSALTEVSSTLASSSFAADDQVYVDVVATDADGSTAAFKSSVVTIANSAPSAPTSVSLSPADPGPTDTITCTGAGGTDADGDSISYRYRWYNGTTLVSTTIETGAGTLTLSPSNTMPDDAWSCTANTFDGQDESDADVTSGDVVVALSESCDDYYDLGYRTDGDFVLDTPTGGEQELYCEFRTDGGWTQIVDDDYSTDSCRGSWVSSTSVYGGECVVNGPATRTATLDTHGLSYSDVRIDVGLSQFASPDGFVGGATDAGDAYAEGLMLVYNDSGWKDIHTWLLITETPACTSQTAPFTLLGSFDCTSTFGSGPWTNSWASGLDYDGFRQFSLGSSTTASPVAKAYMGSDNTDENLALRHMTLFIK